MKKIYTKTFKVLMMIGLVLSIGACEKEDAHDDGGHDDDGHAEDANGAYLGHWDVVQTCQSSGSSTTYTVTINEMDNEKLEFVNFPDGLSSDNITATDHDITIPDQSSGVMGSGELDESTLTITYFTGAADTCVAVFTKQ